MCNNNLSAPQRKFETSIFLWKSRHHLFILGRLAGGSDTKLIGQHKLSAWFQHLPERRGFISTKNQRWVQKIQKPAAALIKAKICHFSSTFLKSISWDSPFQGTVLRDRFKKCWRKLTDLGLNKGRGWFLNFSEAPLIFGLNKTSSFR